MKYQIKMNYFELPYFNMSTVASLPLCLRRILLSAIMMSISATLSSSSSFPVSMNKFVSPTIDSVFEVAAICYCWFMWHNKTISPSSLPVCRYVSLSRTMNVHSGSGKQAGEKRSDKTDANYNYCLRLQSKISAFGIPLQVIGVLKLLVFEVPLMSSIDDTWFKVQVEWNSVIHIWWNGSRTWVRRKHQHSFKKTYL